MKLKLGEDGVFLSGKYEFPLETIDKLKFDVKIKILGIFYGFHLSTFCKRGGNGNKEGSILMTLI